MRRRRNQPIPDDPWRVLGLAEGSSPAAINEARRRLAKQAHPDVGGSLESMQRINQAAASALADLPASGQDAPTRTGARSSQTDRFGPARRDHPSFTIEVLPAEAFEGLVVVSSWLGDLISDDPPYVLEVALVDPIRGWCRLELGPDAGASTVSLAVAAEPGYPVPDVDRVRDLFIDGLNRLDWTEFEGPAERPA